MLDTFEIITTAGVVIWQRNFTRLSPSVINNFITDTFIEDKNPGAKIDTGSARTNHVYKTDSYTVKWSVNKDLGVIFAAVHRTVLHLPWVDELVDNINTLFISLYEESLKRPDTTIVNCKPFDKYFDQQLSELEQIISTPAAKALPEEFSADESANSRPVTPFAGGDSATSALASPGAKLSRRQRKANNTQSTASGNESSASTRKVKTGKTANAKKGRKWDADGVAIDIHSFVYCLEW